MCVLTGLETFILKSLAEAGEGKATSRSLFTKARRHFRNDLLKPLTRVVFNQCTFGLFKANYIVVVRKGIAITDKGRKCTQTSTADR